MRRLTSLIEVGVFAGLGSAVAVVVGFAAWPQGERAVVLAGLSLTAIFAAAFEPHPAESNDRSPLLLSFAIVFVALVLCGAAGMTFIATAVALTQGLFRSNRAESLRDIAVRAAFAILAAQAAGVVHAVLGGTQGSFVWPWQGVPIAAAVVAYCVAMSGPTRGLRHCPLALMGGSAAVALVDVIGHGMWEILPVAGIPLLFAYRAYVDSMGRLDTELRQVDVIDSVDEGVAVLDLNGVVRHWNSALARIVDCPRDRVVGRSLVAAVPGLGDTNLLRTINESLKDHRPRTLEQVEVTCASGSRTLRVKILPEPDRVAVLWHDITAQARATAAYERSEARLALLAAGANDGLWEWDLRTHECFLSPRWWALLGLPPSVGTGRPADWFDRVHVDDLEPLKQVLGAHLSGQTDHVFHEHRIRHEDGTYLGFLCRAVAIRGKDGRAARIAGSFTDTERAVAQDRRGGFRDPLTGLCNRAVFVERLGQRLNDFKLHHRGRFAALYLDLDRFKLVNDSLGHLVGDELLVAVSRRLEACLRPGDAAARLGGDEFAILLEGLTEPSQANAIAFRIQDSLSAPFSIGGREVFTSASIGIAFCVTEYNNAEEIMRDADIAMYHAKARGKSRHEMFDADMHAQALDRLGLEDDLRQAVKRNDFEVYYQPIVTLATGMCVGFEALVRWKRNGQPVSPATFIPVAEELGLIEPLGTWVLQEACRTFAGWQRRFPGRGLDCITVNVSTRQLMQQHFRYLVEQAVEKAGLRPCDLRLEITETTIMDSPTMAAEVLRDLRDFGVKIYLDDFGTGYSSLSHLHNLPVDALKIDSSFVKSLLLEDRPAIVESILALARTLGTSVVAEGVESYVQSRELQRLGCRQAQGFYFSKPLPTAAVEELMAANQPLGRKPDNAAPVRLARLMRSATPLGERTAIG
jgi:diguanylate cyclase (GGDEF)-like protein